MHTHEISYMLIPGITGETNEQLKDKIIEVIPYYFKIPWGLINSKSRLRKYCYPRQLIIWFLRKKTSMNLMEVASLFHMDHTTIIHNVQQINNLRATDTNVYADISAINLLL